MITSVMSSGNLHLDYANTIHRQLKFEQENAAHRWNRRIVILLGTLCNLDLQARFEEQCHRPSEQAGVVARFGGLKRSSWKKNAKFGWLANIVMTLFVLFAGHLVLVLYHQYSHDFHLLQLRQLRRHGNHPVIVDLDTDKLENNLTGEFNKNNNNNDNRLGLEESLLDRMQQAKHCLEQLGSSAYLHLTIIAECLYVSVLAYSLAIYLANFIIVNFSRPFDFHFIHELIDANQELVHTQNLIKEQVNRFIESSQMYFQIELEEQTLNDGQTSARLMDAVSTNPHDRLRRELQLIGALNNMLATGSLTPMNKLNKWARYRSNLELVCHVCMAFYAIVFDVAIISYSLSLNYSKEFQESWHLMRLLPVVSCSGLLVICFFSVSLNPPIYFTATLDQIAYVSKLDQLITKCIASNTRAFFTNLPSASNSGQLLDQRQSLDQNQLLAAERTARLMNSNYLFVLMHYEIFVSQLRPIKYALGPLISTAIAILFIMPIVVRLHLDYIMEINDGLISSTKIRVYALALSTTVLMPANFSIVPLCHLNSRCQGLYKRLSSLMAHIIEIRSFQSGANIYDSHAISILNKKLSHPQQLLHQFVIHSAGFWGTYTTLIKAHFWWGLLALSILVEHQAGQRTDILEMIFKDPFGVFSQ